MTRNQVLEILNQVDFFDIEINKKIQELEVKKSKAFNITVNNENERVQTSGNNDVVGNSCVDCVLLQQEINTMIDDFYEIKKSVKQMIDSIDSEKQKDVLYRKYILLEKLPKIAYDLKITYNNAKQIHRNGILSLMKKY